MTPFAYQQAAARTICPQQAAFDRLWRQLGVEEGTQLIHGLLGISAEAGELWSLVQKVFWYNKSMTAEEFKAQVALEIGDVLWYAAETCSALGLDLGEVMEANITKLRKRYPEKYTDFHAAEENRDRAREEDHVGRGVLPGTNPATKEEDLRFLREMYNNLPEELKAKMREEQRTSWVRGEMALAEEERKTTMVGPSVAAVMEARRHAAAGGCCDRFGDQQACDCLAKAVERDRRMARGDEFCRRVRAGLPPVDTDAQEQE